MSIHTLKMQVWQGVEGVEPTPPHHTLYRGVGCGVDAPPSPVVVWIPARCGDLSGSSASHHGGQ